MREEMDKVALRPGGGSALPTPEVPIRITRKPMDPELEKELADWRELGNTAWDAFPYEEHE